MIPNCEGCEYEFEEAIRLQDEDGLHFATTKKQHGINERKHLCILMVNYKGKIMIW